ncbi:hypothetical protein B2M23_15010 [Eubacterium limosum]|uniref:Uncharacterized protein n=1 Tax=Eubacterium limosum TaxID=1736 RepID=A0AAC9QW63_EUBLI|nr:hypothetical protein B2M23_15010 [Eubacterium limosum]
MPDKVKTPGIIPEAFGKCVKMRIILYNIARFTKNVKGSWIKNNIFFIKYNINIIRFALYAQWFLNVNFILKLKQKINYQSVRTVNLQKGSNRL